MMTRSKVPLAYDIEGATLIEINHVFGSIDKNILCGIRGILESVINDKYQEEVRNQDLADEIKSELKN